MDRSQATPVTHMLANYQPPSIAIKALDLRFDLDLDDTCVVSTMDIERVSKSDRSDIRLFGDELVLESVAVNGKLLSEKKYSRDGDDLVLHAMSDRFRLQIVTRISPSANTALMGLYGSSGNLCTQCEAEGFRRMTYFPDRPDVLTIYTCTLTGSRKDFPVLLSNGNLVDTGKLPDNRHYATWHDPWPKPSYLFALVAGHLEYIEDKFVTSEGREVVLRVYVEKHNIDKCDHAMAALIKSMRWDEQVYGRVYDLDIYNIVAVDDFNMGAMENKSLNVFNSKYVLATPATATDADYQHIEGVIAHEYFHNWSGNRVTCRDWFQLSLKEGFTVFRDQEFSADTFSRGVKRIEDVNMLRSHQFREDAGPMAHPVRPESYVEINNFYTSTVYNKGAEVVRMLYSLLGRERFLAGTTLYFDRYDGQAVTIEDFVGALEDANDEDLSQFRRWYEQAGTPRLDVVRKFSNGGTTLSLTIRQTCPDTPGQSGKAPFHIPLRIAMIGPDGKRQQLKISGAKSTLNASGDEAVLELTEPKHTFTITDLQASSVPSMLREFSAPVILETDLSFDELAFLMSHDDDPFNRWEAGQKYATDVILTMIDTIAKGKTATPPKAFIKAWGNVLAAPMKDLNFKAEALRLPSEVIIAESLSPIDPEAIHSARSKLIRSLAKAHADTIEEVFTSTEQALNKSDGFSPDAEFAGMRALKNVCLSMLASADVQGTEAACLRQIDAADNMTDELAAMTCIAHSSWSAKEDVVDSFLSRWRDEALVVDKWLRAQATAPGNATVKQVIALTKHRAYSERNPNKVYSLIGGFSVANPACFHAKDGSGYRFLGSYIKRLDEINPQVAARMMSAFTPWRRYDKQRQALMREQLEAILAKPGLSSDVFEIASKSLN